MADPGKKTYRVLVLSVIKHAYLPDAVAAHPRFALVAVADDALRPDWTHERNQKYADMHAIPYCRNVEEAFRNFDCDIASSVLKLSVIVTWPCVLSGLGCISSSTNLFRLMCRSASLSLN